MFLYEKEMTNIHFSLSVTETVKARLQIYHIAN